MSGDTGQGCLINPAPSQAVFSAYLFNHAGKQGRIFIDGMRQAYAITVAIPRGIAP